MENLRAADGMNAQLDIEVASEQGFPEVKGDEIGGVKFVETIIARTPWGNRTVMLPEFVPEKVEETEEQTLARIEFEKAAEEAQAAEKAKVDAWWESCLGLDEDGKYVLDANTVASVFNITINKKKHKMTAWEVIKIRAKFGVPEAACHTKGKKFFRGSGKRRQEYVVQRSGAWKKVVNA